MKKFTLTSSILLITFITNAQITFQKTYGGADEEQGLCVRQTLDGGYIITGVTTSFGAGDADVYLIKTDNKGDTLWTKTFGGNEADVGHSVQQTTDGGYIVVGSARSFNAFSHPDVYLIKTDVNGNSFWTKTFGGTEYDFGYSVQQTSDGGYIIGGSSASFGVDVNVYLIKTDSNGDTLWTKIIGGIYPEWCRSVEQTSDGGYIIVGTSQVFGIVDADILFIKTDSIGNSLWTKIFDGTSNDFGESVQQTTDGGYIITGSTKSFGAGNADACLIKTDLNGNSLWTKTFGGVNDDGSYSVQQTSDGGYIIAGGRENGASIGNVYLIKTDVNGDMLWTKTFGGTNDEWSNSVMQTTDGGYIIASRTESFGAGMTDIYLIKTDSLGNSGCNQGNTATIVTTPVIYTASPLPLIYSGGTVTIPATIVGSGGIVTTLCTTVGINEITADNLFLIVPNPVSDKLNITINNNSLSEIILYDIASRKLLQHQFTNTVTLNTVQLAKGIYIYEVRNRNGVERKGKVVKE